METSKLVQAFESELNLTEQGLRELTELKKGLVIDVHSDAGFKLARKERTERNKITKNIDDLAIEGKRSVDEARGILKERVNDIYAPTVNAFEIEDVRRKEEAKRLAQIEAERVEGIRTQINSIRQFAQGLTGKSSGDIQDIIEAVDMIDVSENFAELTQEALTVKKETLTALSHVLAATIQNEQISAEREQLRKEREEIAAVKAELAQMKASQEKPVAERLAERFVDSSNNASDAAVEAPVTQEPSLFNVQQFLASLHQSTLNDFGYLLLSGDGQHEAEALYKIKESFANFMQKQAA